MVKRRLSALLLALLLLAVPFAASADTGDVRIEQVQSVMPLMRAYFYVEGGGDITAEAALNLKKLEAGELRMYDPAVDATDYYFLVDCSTSTTSGQMRAVRESLVRFAGELGPNDTATILTFGVAVDAVVTRERDGAKIVAAAEGLRADQEGTLFFDALAKAIELSGRESEAMNRKLGFVFSDSVDYNLGGHTKDEIDRMLSGSGIPFYALGFNTGSKEQLDNFGAVARLSGGAIAVVSESQIEGALFDMIADTKEAHVAEFFADTNIIEATKQDFQLKIVETGNASEIEIPVKYWTPDTEAPKALSVSQDTDESLRVAFSERVAGATNPESYVVKNEAGDLLGIRAAAYDEETNTATLTFSEPPPSGMLALTFPGITDVSMEENRVASELEIDFSGRAAERPVGGEDEEGLPIIAWFVITIIAVAIIAAIAVSAVKRRREQSALEGDALSAGAATVEQQLAGGQNVQVHVVSADLPIVSLSVINPNGESRRIELPINKTLFVGRSDICDIYFDDSDMSRQHFVIEENAGSYTITNISETNGTLLNGVKIVGTRPLYENDRIEAGREVFLFHGTKAQQK